MDAMVEVLAPDKSLKASLHDGKLTIRDSASSKGEEQIIAQVDIGPYFRKGTDVQKDVWIEFAVTTYDIFIFTRDGGMFSYDLDSRTLTAENLMARSSEAFKGKSKVIIENSSASLPRSSISRTGVKPLTERKGILNRATSNRGQGWKPPAISDRKVGIGKRDRNEFGTCGPDGKSKTRPVVPSAFDTWPQAESYDNAALDPHNWGGLAKGVAWPNSDYLGHINEVDDMTDEGAA